jgi:hypothetical protein
MLTREGLADPGGTGVATLAELMPQPVGPDPRLVTDGAVDVSMASGPLEGARDSWMRRWQNADGGATMAAYRYASPTEARRHAEAWLTEQAKSTIETFEIPDVAVDPQARSRSRAGPWEQVDVECVHGLAAVLATQVDAADLAASVVAVEHRGAGLAGQPPVAPADHDREQVDELGPLGRQVVLVARPSVVRAALQHPLVDEVVEALSEHLARDPEVRLELVEPPHPDPDVAQDQRRPRLSDHVERACDRAGHVPKAGALHGRIVAIGVPLGNFEC